MTRQSTMNGMLQKVKEKYPDDITSRHISNIFRNNNITLKLTRFIHEPTKRFGKDININKNIKFFYEKVKHYKSGHSIIVERVRDALRKHNHKKVFKKYTGIFDIYERCIRLEII
jgi:hypothetical protein